MFKRNNTALIALFIFTVISFQTLSYAQLNTITVGSASDLGGNCYQITPDQIYQSGGVWYDNPIEFANDFTIYYQNNFGTKDGNGADGMALVFKTDATAATGITGGGLGYEGISNSLIIEFDTFKNNSQSDPSFDHIGIMSNGVANHSANYSLEGPIQASATSSNIEDGIDHNIKIVWIANTKTLEVYFDCNLRLSVTKDVKTDIFDGDSSVFFGFVGSTGASSNLHQVCFNSISFVENLNLVNKTICLGETVLLDATIPSGVSYSWSPTTGVSNPYVANPIFSPTTTTIYTATITDICGDRTTEDLLISVNLKEIPNFTLINSICKGDINPLVNTSKNGITGNWLPAFNTSATTTYTFTPDPEQCANTTTITITVNPINTPTFIPVYNICIGDSLVPLPTTSKEGITGTWSPVLDNTTITVYTFTPDPGLCAIPTTLTIVVLQNLDPIFTSINEICKGGLLTPLQTVSDDGIRGTWSPALDNTITTNYTFTPTPVSGICLRDVQITIAVLNETIPSFTQVQETCIGDFIVPLPTESQEGIRGVWSPAINNMVTTIYSFSPDPGQCAQPTQMEIKIKPISILSIDAEVVSEDFVDNQTIVVTVTGGSGDYEYQLDTGAWQNTAIFENIFGCETYTVSVREALGCSTEPQKNINLIHFPKFFTPNNDGFNDTWNIKCLENQASAKIRIFDRFGKLIKEIRPSGNGWNGTYNGTMLAGTDYWFEINYIDSNGIDSKYNAHFSLRL